MTEMERLQNEAEAFVRGLYEGERKVLVFGEGRVGASVMMIGEAPGEQESLQRRPFVGKAGKNLDAFLNGVGLDRDALYVTNVVKFRPTKRSAAGRTVNRPPTQEEVRLFLPWLLREIELVGPRYVITLGNVPLRALYGQGSVIGQVHGQFLDWSSRTLYPMYHPASVIYNPSLKEAWREDVARFAQRLREQT
uniref:Type-4 uracil-DNA glycosylase n=1 Tax=uncultured bacterium Ad_125_D08 TaxID=1489285 RepID=A0A0B4N146_9BACT|nr:putative uracil-DNA glycosylase, family 4 [uncultured bacterium Ad_125_D08]